VAWYAVHTRSRHEQSVHRQLVTKNIEALLPTVSRWSRWTDRRKTIDWPLFPGYCFARFESSDKLRVLTCTGVVGIVSFGGELAVVPDDEIVAIQRVLDSHLPYDACPFVREGTRVEVVRGPLAGLIGRLIRKGSNAQLILSVEVVNGAVSVMVAASDVTPI
jgi:transcription antitermination factor NusG